MSPANNTNSWLLIGAAVLLAVACSSTTTSEPGAAAGAPASDAGDAASGGSSGDGSAGAGGTAGAVATGGSAGAGGTAGAGATGGSAGAAGSGAGGSAGSPCDDPCPAPNGGVTWQCKKRFLYGVNYAWNVFGGDFGGVPQWGQHGVSNNAGAVSADLADMRAHGAGTIRWWMFPDFRGAGVTFDASDTPTGLGGTAVADIDKALELAEQNDVYLMLTLFSFDAFKPTGDVSGIRVPGIAPMVTDDARRAALMQVVRQVAQTVEASPYAHRMMAWDVINEPEWAISGTDPYADPAFTPDASSLQTVTFSQMETFVKDAISALRGESSALVTVGGAAAKWARDWSQVDVDFYSLHIYDWVDQYWPYSDPPGTYGLSKPIVMQEMAFDGLSGTPYGTVVQSFWDTGYAGAMPWMWTEASAANKSAFKAFADQHGCETVYSHAVANLLAASAHPFCRAAPVPGVIPSLRRCRVLDGVPDCSGAR